MTRRSKGELVAECDECGAEAYGGTEDDFRRFVDRIKEDGWKIRKADEEWQHVCPECQQ